MPSKVRVAARLNGNVYVGSRLKRAAFELAVKYRHWHVGETIPKGYKGIVDLLDRIKGDVETRVLVLREPRRISQGRSRYKEICHRQGVGMGEVPRMVMRATNTVPPPNPRRTATGATVARPLSALLREARNEQLQAMERSVQRREPTMTDVLGGSRG